MGNCTTDRKLYLGNDTPIEITDYHNPFASNEQIIDATITLTVVDSNGAQVTGVGWPLTIPYVALSKAYRATIQSTANWVEGGVYTFRFSGQSPGGLDAHWEVDIIAERRMA